MTKKRPQKRTGRRASSTHKATKGRKASTKTSKSKKSRRAEDAKKKQTTPHRSRVSGQKSGRGQVEVTEDVASVVDEFEESEYDDDAGDDWWDEDDYWAEHEEEIERQRDELLAPRIEVAIPPTFEINGYVFGGFGRDNPDAKLAGADLSGKEMVHSRLTRADLRGAKLDSSGLSGADLIDADLSGASLIEASLVNAQLAGADFSNAILKKADLSGADLAYVEVADEDGEAVISLHHNSAIFQNADLSTATLRGVKGFRARFESANLCGADLSSKFFLFENFVDRFGAHTVLESAVFDGASMREADLSCVRLDGASFRGADLRGANLSGADLRNADFTGANLTGATLIGGRLKWAGSGTQHDQAVSGAMLAGARLSQTVLIDVNLEGVDLANTDLSGAILTDSAQ